MKDSEDGAVQMSGPEFTSWLRRLVGEQDPAAVLRFADGELQLLEADPDDDESMRIATRKLQKETGLPLSGRDVLEIKALLALAYDEADVLGIHFGNPFQDKHKARLDTLLALHAERLAAGRRPVPLAHCLLNHHILDALPEMLAGRRVSVISCRDLEPVLEEKWGLDDVAVYQVPSQFMVRDVDGGYEAALHDVPIWPDVHSRIRSDLTVREPGEVFLVGAGLFGKDLCVRVRDQGGIALDMGSALDRIAGKRTRGPDRRALDLYAGGTSVEDIALYLQRLFGVQVAEGKVLQTVDAFLDDVAAWPGRALKEAYRLVYFDALRIEIGSGHSARTPICGLAFGVTPAGDGELLGVWWQDGDEAHLWSEALSDIRDRGVRDMQVVCADGLQGFEQAVGSTFPQVPAARDTGPGDAMSRRIRKAVEVRGSFPDEEAATKLICVVATRARNGWRGERSWIPAGELP